MNKIKLLDEYMKDMDNMTTFNLSIKDAEVLLKKQAEQITEYREELKAVYSSEPCPKCGYGITGGCYGCEIKQLKEEIQGMQEDMAGEDI